MPFSGIYYINEYDHPMKIRTLNTCYVFKVVENIQLVDQIGRYGPVHEL